MTKIYLDNSATTQVRAEVTEAMLPYLKQHAGNPSSVHSFGVKAKEAITNARKQVAELLSCEQQEIFFSPCGTYSNNVAIRGRARFAEANGQGRHLITTPIEHPSVLGPVKYLESQGWQVTYLPVDAQGLVSPESLSQAIRKDTSIISIMWANNEIGSLLPISDLALIAQESGVFFHSDAVQAAARVPVDLSAIPISALSLSGHKLHAPKGIGALFVRRETQIMPIVFGGGQERGLFPGTEGVPNIVALGKAAQMTHSGMPDTTIFLVRMQKMLVDKLKTVPGLRFSGPENTNLRLPGHISVLIPDVEGEALVLRADLQGVAISSASACHTGTFMPSHVLRALGLPDDLARGSARISIGALNTEEECKRAADILVDVFSKCPRAVKI